MNPFITQEGRVFGPYPTGDPTNPSVMGDPLRIWRTLQYECGGDWKAVCQASNSEDPNERFQAETALIQATLKAFSLTPHTPQGQGMTEAEALQVHDNFVEWLNRFSRPGTTGPTVPSPTAPTRHVGIP